MSEYEQRLRDAYAKASARLYNKGKGLTFSEGAQGAEAEYSQAWSALTRAGFEMPLRKKYRGR